MRHDPDGVSTVQRNSGLVAHRDIAAATTDAAAPALNEVQIRALASLQLELNAARDEFNTAIAAIHEAEAQQEVRAELVNKRAEILRGHGMSESEYQAEIFAVSTDNAARALFDRFLKEAAEAAPPANAPAR